MTDSKKELKHLLRLKGSERIQINSLLAAVSIGSLAVFLFFEDKFSPWSVGELAIAIPCLVTSSLAYAKVCYRYGEHRHWDMLGWLTHSIGYLIINAIFILIYRSNFQNVSWLFLGMVISLFLAYSIIDIMVKRKRIFEKSIKFIFYLFLIFVGSILPILFKTI